MNCAAFTASVISDTIPQLKTARRGSGKFLSTLVTALRGSTAKAHRGNALKTRNPCGFCHIRHGGPGTYPLRRAKSAIRRKSG
jgi:hypothetical protein